jgi:inner membrane protein
MLSGPVLRIPFTKNGENIKTWYEGKQVEEIMETKHYAYFLPEEYRVKSDITTEVRKRGIFEVVVYKSGIDNECTIFGTPDFSGWSIPDQHVHWKEAVLLNGISDLRGIGENPVVKAGEQTLRSEPLSDIGITVNQYPQANTTQATDASSVNLKYNQRNYYTLWVGWHNLKH